MSVKSKLVKRFASIQSKRIYTQALCAIKHQEKMRVYLVCRAKKTKFGKQHQFTTIKNYEDFKKHVPLRNYEDFIPYIEDINKGSKDVLWPWFPLYRAETSWTTAGKKYIPITRESLKQQLRAARNALLVYIARTGNSEFLDGKLIFLQWSPVLQSAEGIKTDQWNLLWRNRKNIKSGRLSGIVANHVPKYLQKNRLPSYKTNSIEDRQEKELAIVQETIDQDMRLISGIPPRIQSYFDKLLEISGKKTISELYTKLSLIVRGWVNFEPYKEKLFRTIGKEIDTIETYPASEWFFAYQDGAPGEGLLLNTNAGIFYEFVTPETIDSDSPERVSLQDIELNKNYVLIVSTNAGLWGYNTGDMIKFVSKNPYRIVVTWRVKYFISAFGEHVIAQEIEHTIIAAQQEFPDLVINEFSVAPYVSNIDWEKWHYQWYIECDDNYKSIDIQALSSFLDTKLSEQNAYYKDNIDGKILSWSVIKLVQAGGFSKYAAERWKLGSQHKAIKLSNDREYVSGLDKYLIV